MKKSILSLLLAVILTFGATQGMVSAFASAESNKDTPVAQIANDDYVPYNYTKKSTSKNSEEEAITNLTKEVKSAGGYVKTYSSEENYLNAQKNVAVKRVSNFGDEDELVKQTIYVMTTSTGTTANGNYVGSKPVANAIVRINGVPRYTDRDGKIKAALTKGDYVELFIEKEGYNPYIEIMEITGEDKTVHIKQPNDDIDIYAVMLNDIEYQPVNLITSEYTIYLDALGEYIANIEFGVSPNADVYRLILDDETIYTSLDNVIPDVRFNEQMIGKDFYVQVVYQGITSKLIKLNLSVAEPLDFDEKEVGQNYLNPFDGANDGGIFGGFNMDLAKLFKLNKILNDNRKSLDLKVSVDGRKGTILITAGFSMTDYFNKNKGGPDAEDGEEKVKEASQKIKDYKEQGKKLEEERQKAQDRLNKTERELEQKLHEQKKDEDRIKRLEAERDENQKKLSEINAKKKRETRELRDDINRANYQIDNAKKNIRERNKKITDIINKKQNRQLTKEDFDNQIAALPGIIKDFKDKFTQHQRGFSWAFEVMGTFEYNFRDRAVSKFAISVDASIGYTFEGTFFIGYVPMFYTVTISGGLKVQLEFYDGYNGWIDLSHFWEHLLISAYVGLEGEVGVGINRFLSVSLFAGAKYTASGYIGVPEFYTENWYKFLGSEFEWEVGIRARILLWDFEFGGGQVYSKDCATIKEIKQGYRDEEIAKPSNYSLAKYNSRAVSVYSSGLAKDNYISEGIYNDAKPQIEKIGDNFVATWIDWEQTDAGISTVLKYSIYDGEIWSLPKAVSRSGNDFYHHMYYDGKDLHVTWQKVKECQNDLEQMCANSEIYYAKFNSSKLLFEDVCALTNDSELDAGPRFVLQENESQKLSIVWQKNSSNDILGFDGTNSIWYSSLNNGKWNEAKKLYETDKYISFVDSAYVNDTLTSAFLEEGDNDLITNDRVVLAVNELGKCTTLPINSETLNNPQFVKTNNTVKLYVFNEGGIVYSDDFNTINELLVCPDLINDTYKIHEDESCLIIYYNKVMEENGVQTFACIYNKEFNIWQKDVLLTDAEYNIMNSSVVVLQNGNLLTIYNEYDKDNEINRLGYNLKQMKKDFAISTVFYDLDTVNNEEFTLNIGITNIGDYPLLTFEVSAFGKEEQIVLEDPIALNKTRYFKITRTFNVSDNGYEEIVLKSDSVQKVYLLPISYVDISIEGVSRYDGLIQYFDLTLTNNTDSDVNVLLDVYYMGELLETIDLKLNAESLYSYSYSNTEFKNDNFVYFIIRTPDHLDKYESDNEISFKISGMLEQSPIFENPYASILQSALNLICQ